MQENQRDRFYEAYLTKYFPLCTCEEECWEQIKARLDQYTGGLLPILYQEIKNLTECVNQSMRSGPPGSLVLLDPGDHEGPTILKQPKSILDKMIRSFVDREREREKIKTKRKTVHVYTPGNFIETMDDLIRFRLLCNYFSDVDRFVKVITQYCCRQDSELRVVREEDRLRILPEDRRNGHRAHHMTCEYSRSGRRARFEIQVTTILHWGWDKKDHSLVYEPSRTGATIGVADQISIAAASEALHLIDEYFDSLRSRMINTDMEKKNERS